MLLYARATLDKSRLVQAKIHFECCQCRNRVAIFQSGVAVPHLECSDCPFVQATWQTVNNTRVLQSSVRCDNGFSLDRSAYSELLGRFRNWRIRHIGAADQRDTVASDRI